MPDPLKEEEIRKLEEEKKKKEEELRRIIEEIAKKSEEIKKERELEIEEIIKKMKDEREEKEIEDIIEEEEKEKREENEEEILNEVKYTNADELYVMRGENYEKENNLYNRTLKTMTEVYNVVKSIYSANEERRMNPNELRTINELEEKLNMAEQIEIPSKEAIKLLRTSKFILEKIKKYN